MKPPIEQSVKFSCPPEALFELYMDSAKHSAATGARARISRARAGLPGVRGALTGRNLLIVPNQMIVQAWRSTRSNASDAGLDPGARIQKAPGGAQVHMVHVNVPPQDHGRDRGWPKYYWKPGRPIWPQASAELSRRRPGARFRSGLPRTPRSRSHRSRGRMSRLRSIATRFEATRGGRAAVTFSPPGTSRSSPLISRRIGLAHGVGGAGRWACGFKPVAKADLCACSGDPDDQSRIWPSSLDRASENADRARPSVPVCEANRDASLLPGPSMHTRDRRAGTGFCSGSDKTSISNDGLPAGQPGRRVAKPARACRRAEDHRHDLERPERRPSTTSRCWRLHACAQDGLVQHAFRTANPGNCRCAGERPVRPRAPPCPRTGDACRGPRSARGRPRRRPPHSN